MHYYILCVCVSTMKTCMPYIAMVVIQVANGGLNILMKISLEQGLNPFVFLVYRHIISIFILGPFAYVLEKKQLPYLSFSVMMKIFVLTTVGTTIHLNVYYLGLTYTSPTVASALSNIIPSLTFIMALVLGLERVRIESARGQAKVLGTLICISGSLIFTFWKGGYLFKALVDRPLIHIYDTTNGSGHGNENWIKGSALILTANIAWSASLILQSMVYRIYPAPLSINVLICIFASLQSSFLGLVFSRNPNLWKLDWNAQLLTIIYSGVFISALVYYLQTWCISNKGPVFAASFSPLLMVVVGLFSAIAFAEQLHLRSLIGAILIIVGLYCVLWGKRADVVVQTTCEKTIGGGDDHPDNSNNNETHV